MKFVRNVKHKTLSDTVYQSLYRQIVSGRLKPGERITETQIAQAEGISRAPIREALNRLADDRLVTLVPRKACYVCRITREEAHEIFEICKRLECLALEYAFDKFDLDKIRGLRENLKKCLDLKESKLSRKEPQLDSKLHSLICDTSRRSNLQDLLGKLWARIQMFRIREAKEPARARLAIRGHIKILNAILRGGKKIALQLLEEHIDVARKYNVANSEYFTCQ